MSTQPWKSSLGGTVAVWVGTALIFGGMLASVFLPTWPLWILLFLGILSGLPFLILGLRLQPSTPPLKETSPGFWPTRAEARHTFWCFVGIATACACFLVPLGILFFIAMSLPSGDNWFVVFLRLVFLGLAVLVWFGWIHFAAKTIPHWFRGKISDKMLDDWSRWEVKDEPRTLLSAAIKHGYLLVMAAVAFSLTFRLIDFESPWLNIDAAPKRTRVLVQVIRWCRGNPNTVTSSSLVVGLGSLAWFGVQMGKTAKRVGTPLKDPDKDR